MGPKILERGSTLLIIALETVLPAAQILHYFFHNIDLAENRATPLPKSISGARGVH